MNYVWAEMLDIITDRGVSILLGCTNVASLINLSITFVTAAITMP